MPLVGVGAHCRNLSETPAMHYTTEAVAKWLELSGQPKWIRFLIDKLKVDGKDLLSLGMEDLTAALADGYEQEEVNEMMDRIRSFRMRQLCEPDALFWRYLTLLSSRGKSKETEEPVERYSSVCSHRDPSDLETGSTRSRSTSLVASLSSATLEERNDSAFLGTSGSGCSLNSNSIGEKNHAGPQGYVNRGLREDSLCNWHIAMEKEILDESSNSVEDYDSQLSLLEEIEKDGDGRFIAKIAQWETPNSFYIVTHEWDKERKELEEQLVQLSGNLRRIDEGDVLFNKPCCVRCPTMGRWMRGRIQKKLPDSQVQVLCVDHGYALECPLHEVRELPSTMFSRPPLCLWCKVKDGGCYGGEDEQCLQKVSEFGYVVAVQITKSCFDRCVVRLFNPKTMEQISS